MRKIVFMLLSAVVVIGLAACAKTDEAAMDAPATEAAAASDASASVDGFAEEAKMAAAPQARMQESVGGALVDAAPPPVSSDQLVSSATSYVDAQRKFIRTANADFRVRDVYESAIAIENIVAKLDGFVVNNQIGANVDRVNRYPIGNARLMELAEYTVRGNLTVRVPSDKTQEFLRALVAQIEFLDQRNFEARDVQFELLRKQLEFIRNQEAQKQLGDLSTSPGKIADKAAVISGQSNAKASRDEAAVLQKEVEDKVAFSTISLSLYQLSKVRKTEMDDVDAIAKAIRPGFFSRLLSAFSTGWYGLLDIVIELFALWPLWLAVGLGIFAIKRYRNR